MNKFVIITLLSVFFTAGILETVSSFKALRADNEVKALGIKILNEKLKEKTDTLEYLNEKSDKLQSELATANSYILTSKSAMDVKKSKDAVVDLKSKLFSAKLACLEKISSMKKAK